jgi:hypothetical protein
MVYLFFVFCFFFIIRNNINIFSTHFIFKSTIKFKDPNVGLTNLIVDLILSCIKMCEKCMCAISFSFFFFH